VLAQVRKELRHRKTSLSDGLIVELVRVASQAAFSGEAGKDRLEAWNRVADRA